MNSFDDPFFKGSTLTYRTRRQVRKSLSPFFVYIRISYVPSCFEQEDAKNAGEYHHTNPVDKYSFGFCDDFFLDLCNVPHKD